MLVRRKGMCRRIITRTLELPIVNWPARPATLVAEQFAGHFVGDAAHVGVIEAVGKSSSPYCCDAWSVHMAYSQHRTLEAVRR